MTNNVQIASLVPALITSYNYCYILFQNDFRFFPPENLRKYAAINIIQERLIVRRQFFFFLIFSGNLLWIVIFRKHLKVKRIVRTYWNFLIYRSFMEFFFFARFYTRHDQNDTSPLPGFLMMFDRNDIWLVRMETTRRCVVIGRRSNKFVSRSAVRSL